MKAEFPLLSQGISRALREAMNSQGHSLFAGAERKVAGELG